jgi:hypothetical protein
MNNKEKIVREYIRKEILSVLKESGPSREFKKASEDLYDAELAQQKLKEKFVKEKDAKKKEALKSDLIKQAKLVQIAQQKFNAVLMLEPADDLDESVKKKRLNELELTTQTTGIDDSASGEDAELTHAFEDGYGDLNAEMQKIGKQVQSDLKDDTKVKQALQQNPTLGKVAKKANEGKVNEALGLTFVASLALAIPGIVRIIGIVVKVIEKSFGGEGKAGEAMIHWGHEQHHKIIKLIEKGMKWIPGYSKLDAKTQAQVAEVVHIVIVAYLALHSGGGAMAAAKQGKVGLTGVETALAAVKSGEVNTFLSTRLAAILGSEAGAV